MRARSLQPTFDELYDLAPKEIKDYIDKCEMALQSPEWHPEGNTLIHMKIVYERARKSGDINMMLAAFFHDIGKATTTYKNKRGTWSAHGHEEVSARMVQKYADWIEEVGGDSTEVYEIVKNHMKVKLMGEMRRVKQEMLRANPYFDKIEAFSQFDNMKTLTPDEMGRYK